MRELGRGSRGGDGKEKAKETEKMVDTVAFPGFSASAGTTLTTAGSAHSGVWRRISVGMRRCRGALRGKERRERTLTRRPRHADERNTGRAARHGVVDIIDGDGETRVVLSLSRHVQNGGGGRGQPNPRRQPVRCRRSRFEAAQWRLIMADGGVISFFF